MYWRERGEAAKSAARKVTSGRCENRIRSSGNRRMGEAGLVRSAERRAGAEPARGGEARPAGPE